MLRAPSSRAADPLWHWNLELGKPGADATIALLSTVARLPSYMITQEGTGQLEGNPSARTPVPPPKQKTQ